MDHLVLPLGGQHLRSIAALRGGAAAAAGVEPPPAEAAHVTLLAWTDLGRAEARGAVEGIVAATGSFAVHAHGFGFFCGDQPTGLAIHVPVVRTSALDAFHRRLWDALCWAGADVASWTGPDLWSPHVTLLDRVLEPAGLGAAAAWLARRHHPSWELAFDRVVLTGGWIEHDVPGDVVRLGSTARTP